jgi:hypothetical protein
MSGNLTEVRLLSNVPLNNSYEHVMDFPNSTEQSSYFLGKTKWTFTDLTYQRNEGFVRIPQGYDDLYTCNYVMYKNREYSNKWFYGFITRKEYVNPNMTKVYFEIDVFQTWQYEMSLKPSFVAREHTKRWLSDGAPVINTIDEGLDYGTEYETVSISQVMPYDNIFFLVIVCTERMDGGQTGITPTLNGSPQPLTYYIHPFKMDGTSPTFTIMGMNINLSPISDVLKGLYTQTGAVNNVANIYVTEYIGFDIPFSGGAFSLPDMSVLEHVTIQDTEDTFNTLRLANLPEYQTRSVNLGNKYTGYASVNESKLMMYPYTVTVLTDLKGNMKEIKNEYVHDTNLVIKTRGSVGVSNKISYHVANYLTNELQANAVEVTLENSVINNNPNDVPIVTDLLSAYLQGNRNSLENQKNSIVFNSLANTVGNVFGGIGSALAGNPVGTVSAGAGMLTGVASAYFQIQGMEAKKQDIDNTPSTLNKMGGNTAFDYGNDIKGLYVIKKQITYEYRKKLEDFFKMFGYKVNELKSPNYKTRQHFNFIQTKGVNVTGDIPQDDINTIKTIFDKGVTVWHGDWLGDYSLTNNEV